MTPRNKFLITLALLLVLGGLGVADYLYQGNSYLGSLTGDQPNGDALNPPEGAVAKNSGPTVEQIAEEQNLTTGESGDLSLLAQIITDGTAVRSLAILSEGDRAGSVTWVESGNVKEYFITLKDALLGSFSPDMRDLKDETLVEAGKPVRNVLTFLDPALSEERIVFVRVRERLFEFHLAAGKEETMNTFIEALTGK